jgi:hypothetical protein
MTNSPTNARSIRLVEEDRERTSMDKAKLWFERQGLRVEVMTDYHLKYEEVNFYPDKGTIFCDGEKRRRLEKGLAGLECVLRERGHLRR